MLLAMVDESGNEYYMNSPLFSMPFHAQFGEFLSWGLPKIDGLKDF